MSPVVRVRADVGSPPPAVLPAPEVPRRITLPLAELIAAARLAGDVPLPIRLDLATTDRLASRLAADDSFDARAEVRRAIERADEDGPTGAVAALTERGLVVDGALTPEPTAALQVLAGGALALQLDLVATRRAGTVPVRSWFGVQGRFVTQLSTAGGRDYELSWYDATLWVSQLERAATVEPRGAEPAQVELPTLVVLATELLLGSGKAIREHRSELVPAMIADAPAIRWGDRGSMAEAAPDEALAILHTLEESCRGRLRVRSHRRDLEEPPAVLSWLLFDDGWHEMRPGSGATTRLRRRAPRDLGLVTAPLVAAAMAVSHG